MEAPTPHDIRAMFFRGRIVFIVSQDQIRPIMLIYIIDKKKEMKKIGFPCADEG
jgi:hypothetical protein